MSQAVTICDHGVKCGQHARRIVWRMKNTTLILNLALLTALPVAADESTLRYDLRGLMQLNMEHNI